MRYCSYGAAEWKGAFDWDAAFSCTVLSLRWVFRGCIAYPILCMYLRLDPEYKCPLLVFSSEAVAGYSGTTGYVTQEHGLNSI